MSPPSDDFKQRVLLAKSNTNFWVKSNLTASTRTLNLNAVRACRCCVCELFSLPWNGSERNFESLLLFLLHGTEFRAVSSSAERFGREFREFASISVLRNGIPSCFLFCWRILKGIPRVCFYFWTTGRNSELFSRPRKGLERISGNFCSAEQSEFRRK